MMNHRELFRCNRSYIKNPGIFFRDSLDFEDCWIQRQLESCEEQSTEALQSQSWPMMRPFFKRWIDEQAALEDENSVYVARTMPLEEFRILVKEFALDGLTEAQVFYYAIPRLPLAAQMSMLKIMIDEFGSGNLQKCHTQLYVELLQELQVEGDFDTFLEDSEESTFEFLNLYFWLAMRADDPSYFVGSLLLLESLVPSFFQCYALACQRLSIQSHHYYTEHQHIDEYHSRECFKILDEMAKAGCLNVSKAWAGMLITGNIIDKAFKEAVRKAKGADSYE